MYKDKIKYVRERNGLTQKQISEILKIERGSYSLYELEYIIIPLKHLITFCNYFNISVDYIFGFTDKFNYIDYSKEINFKISGERLKEFRKSQKLTQEKLAKQLNIARTIISEYEKGKFLIATHSLYTICSKYNISADYLLGKTNEVKYLSNEKTKEIIFN